MNDLNFVVSTVSSLKDFSYALNTVAKCIATQNRVNDLIFVCLAIMASVQYSQNKKIAKLTTELKSLKDQKGE